MGDDPSKMFCDDNRLLGSVSYYLASSYSVSLGSVSYP